MSIEEVLGTKKGMQRKININFWFVQLAGWGLFIVFNSILQGAIGGNNPLAIPGSIVSGTLGLITTSFFRAFIKKKSWLQKRPVQLILLVFVATGVLAVVWAPITIGIVYFIAILKGIPIKLHVFIFVSNYISGQLIFIIWSALYFAYQYFLKFNRAEIEKWQLEATAKDAQLGFLKAQINPHFLFNALNNIRALILEDPAKARDMLTHLSDFLRYPLQYSGKEMVTLATEFEIVQNYLELVHIQYEDKLKTDVHYDAELDQVLIPPMIIQLLVENAVKHGVAVNSGTSALAITVKAENQQLLIEVANTGHLGKSKTLEKKLGVGLNNIRKRIALLYSAPNTFTIIEKNGWVCAQLVLPLQKDKT